MKPHKEDRHNPLPETIERVRAYMPGTRNQIAERMGVDQSTVGRIVTGMIKHGYAEAWGRELCPKGRLVDVIHSTGKQAC